MKRTKHITGFEKTETERKQAEKALKETTNLLQSIMNSSTEVIIIATDSTGNILTWNASATRILGYKTEEIIGKKNMRIFYTEEDIKSGAVEKAIKNMESTRKPLITELNYVTKDGGNLLVHQILTPRFNENGKFIGIIGMSTNINECKKVKKVLKNYQFMVETASDAIFYKDLESRYIIANLKTLKTFGLSREQVIGKNDYELMSNQKEARKNIEDDQIVFKSKTPTEIIKRMTNRANKEYWFQAIKVPQFDAQGNVIGLVGIAIDITERKQAEKEIQQYTAKLKESNEELSQYSYSVSHDLKTPLYAINNYVNMLREDLEGTLNSDQEFYLDCLNTAVNEADEIINDLLELSQVGREKFEIKKINIVELLTEIIDTYANSDDIKITMQDKFPIIKSETVLLRQIFQNLIDNGIKFNKSSQKKIELGWKSVADNRIEFFVRDNGIGIASRHQKQIFRVFEKLHTKKEYEGSGIGLALVKKAINKLGGSIRVESKPGKGSIFIIILSKE